MPQLLLKIKDLSVSFTSDGVETVAVNDISFDLEKGGTLGIVGESGSGKSVSALTIMGLIPQPPGKINSGAIHYFSSENTKIALLKLTEKEKRSIRGKEISMIFQEPMTSLNPSMRCGRQVAENILQHTKSSRKSAKLDTIKLFEEVQLPRPNEIYRAFPHQLSGGQKQRVMIAMALACNPNLLIADEPTTALDVTVQESILQLITHDLGIVAEFANDVLVMHNGKIVEKGSTKGIFHHPTHPYTKGLIACRPPIKTRPKRLLTVADFLDESTADAPDAAEIVTEKEQNSYHQKLYSSEPILRLSHIKTHFSESRKLFSRNQVVVKAVDDVSLEVYPGETIGLVGESGCGKTTLGRTILQLVDSTGGEVVFKNTDLKKLGAGKMKSFRRQMQIIFQDPYSSLNPRITAGRAIMEPMRVHNIIPTVKARKQKALELMEKTGLDPSHFNRYPHEFSGGQRQRICIARALSVHPEFIICDESVSALDVSIQAQVLNLLNDLKEEFGFTYIFISHDLSVVKYMSDRIVVMKDGKIQEIGDADEVFFKPKTAYTRQLIDAIPKG